MDANNNFDWVYQQKASFCVYLSIAYRRCTLEVDDIRYIRLKNGLELVRIDFIDGAREYINVSADSIEAIGHEVSQLIHKGEAFGLIRRSRESLEKEIEEVGIYE